MIHLCNIVERKQFASIYLCQSRCCPLLNVRIVTDCQGKVTSALRRAYLGCKSVAHSKCVEKKRQKMYQIVWLRPTVPTQSTNLVGHSVPNSRMLQTIQMKQQRFFKKFTCQKVLYVLNVNVCRYVQCDSARFCTGTEIR